MNEEDAHGILSTHLAQKGLTHDLHSIMTIRERYEPFRKYVGKESQLPIVSGIVKYLEAQEIYMRNMQQEMEAQQTMRLGEDAYSQSYQKYIDEEDREIIKNVGKPLPPSQIANNEYLEAIYIKTYSRTTHQKIITLEKTLGSKPGQTHVHARGLWREPKWKQKQMKLRVLEWMYLSEFRYLKEEYM